MMRFTLALMFALLPVLAHADAWLEDWEAAKKQSAATGKPILVNITGSDWCPPCIQMEAEVFSQPAFADKAGRYILLRLDYPRNLPQPEKVRVQNQVFSDKYPFEGFPTFALMDAQGVMFAKHTGYVAGGVRGFFTTMTGLEGQRATLAGLLEAVKKAAPGADRARAQDALFRQAEAWELDRQYADLPLKITQEDRDGKAGLRPRYLVYNAFTRYLATWAESSDFRKAAADLETMAAQAKTWPDLQQRILFTQGMVWLNGVGDEARARDLLVRARALGDVSPWGAKAAELLDQLP